MTLREALSSALIVLGHNILETHDVHSVKRIHQGEPQVKPRTESLADGLEFINHLCTSCRQPRQT